MYFLEESRLLPKKMPYSYGRRALGTLFVDQWKQLAYCEERQPLVDAIKELRPGKYRIISNDGHEQLDIIR